MKITNRFNLPESFVIYASKDDHIPTENKYSVTELLSPVRQILLKRKLYDRIEMDVSDIVPALFGTAVHSVLETNTPLLVDIYPEFQISYDFGGTILSGRIDLLNLKSLSIEDYKTCSVNKVIRQDFEDWKMQGLLYAYLVYRVKGIILKHLKFYSIMKDWSKVKSKTSSNYPNSAVYVWEYDIQDSDFDYIEEWLKRKLKEINFYLETDTLPECTNEEKWYTGDKYAVYKKVSDKRAAIVCDNEEEAYGYITNKCNGAGQIEIRKGECLKCKYYCNVSKFCLKGDK